MDASGASRSEKTFLCAVARRQANVCKKSVMKSCSRFKYSSSRSAENTRTKIGYADQTPVWSDAPENMTAEAKGTKSVRVLATEATKKLRTVMLCITAQVHKLPPYVLFKRKCLPAEQFPDGIFIRAREKGRTTDKLVRDWVTCVCQKCPGANLDTHSVLVPDSFRGHLTGGVRQQLRTCKTDLVIIPGGTTGMLPPLDVPVNRPFKW